MFFLFLFFAFQSFAQTSFEKMAQSFFLQERAVQNLKKSAYKRFQLADNKKTSLSLVYLHGFSASPNEVSPLVENLATTLKANAYWPRFAGHGIAGTEGLRGIKFETWQEETRLALQMGKDLGEEVIVIATSTAAPIVMHELLKDSSQIKTVILLSPNFGLPRWDTELLLIPGGAWFVKKILGEYREWKPKNSEQAENWTTKYPTEVLVEMMKAVKLSRGDKYQVLKVPLLTFYCENDSVIDPKKIPDKLNSVNKSTLFKMHCEEDTHILAGKILSPKNTEKVYREILSQLNQF